MAKMVGRTAGVCAALLCLAAGFCDAADDQRWLVAREHAAKNELKIVWQFNLPLGDGERLERLFILGNGLYGLSSRNYLVCIARDSGAVRFSSSIAPVGLPVSDFVLHSDGLVCVVGGELLEISAELGTRRSTTRLDFAASCPAARNNDHFYIGATDKRLHVLLADNKVQMFEAAAENDSAITSVFADEDAAIFTTAAGNVICIKPDSPTKLWQFDAAGRIAAAVVRDANSLFVAGNDTNLYRLDILTGKLVWKYQCAAVLSEPPQVGKIAAYQRADGKGLDAIDKENGKLLWHLADGVGLLAESGDRAYVLAAGGVIVVMDNAKQKQVRRVEFAGELKYASNSADSKIYIGDKTGRLACLEPIE